jgi:hypothetical protein
MILTLPAMCGNVTNDLDATAIGGTAPPILPPHVHVRRRRFRLDVRLYENRMAGSGQCRGSNGLPIFSWNNEVTVNKV